MSSVQIRNRATLAGNICNASPAADTAPALLVDDATVVVVGVAGTRQSHRDTVRGLGLRKVNSTRTLEDTPAVRGMINKVAYLVLVL